MSQDVVKPDEAMEPGEWIRAQKARLAEKAVGEKQRVNEKERAAEAEKRKLVRAFAPIAKYMTEVAAAGVSLKSYGRATN